MPDFYIYLSKSALLLAVFYASYRVLLQKSTFLNLNRAFLLTGILVALFLPLWIVTEIVYIDAPTIVDPVLATTHGTQPLQLPEESSLTPYEVMQIIYGIGVLFFASRFIIQLLSLVRVLKSGTRYKTDQYTIIEADCVEAPFSFFNYIVINSTITDAELDAVLSHEKAHAFQKHSADMLLTHLICIFQWFNPIAWLYKKATNENLEFIADKATLEVWGNKKEYQYLLLEQSSNINIHQLNIINTFNSSIKKRIVMLNKQKSKRLFLWKYLSVVPLLVLFIYTLNTETIAQIKTTSSSKQTAFNVVVDKNSTDTYLSEQIRFIKENTGIALTFNEVNRNANNEIVSLNSSFESTGSRGKYNSGTHENGIPAFKFHVYDEAGDYVTGYGPVNDRSRIFMVNRNTSDEKLDYFVRTFKEEYGGTLTFFNVKRNEKGEIIAIASNFKGPDGNSGSTSIEGIIPIGHLVFSFEFDANGKIKEIGYKTAPGITKHQIDASLIVIDGKIQDNYDPKSIAPEEIKHMNILKGKDAIDRYGAKGKDGVIEISTYKQGETNITNTLNTIKSLIVVDGVEKKPDFNVNTITPDQIESVKILKGENATRVYGEKGKNGVILITTKKAKTNQKTKQQGSSSPQKNNTPAKVAIQGFTGATQTKDTVVYGIQKKVVEGHPTDSVKNSKTAASPWKLSVGVNAEENSAQKNMNLAVGVPLDHSSFVITKRTSDKLIQAYVDDLMKKGIEYHISGIERNENGHITAIKIVSNTSKENKFAGSATWDSSRNPDGIPNIIIGKVDGILVARSIATN
ncbi:TonB-dependent outer membrane receptor, SusC/RagA subfamily, signature region [Zhouia amylolytica]|uniref:TonB-dependent outer membrane receptor, SusC/RagA subfamily, signature region n=1 Tax=Zhouia amylolytica TaxID=376730 RepID=A0A1I6U2M1_9FLAO|nr:M56 family metallopeptidase [Zhouia amylolytica]SFS95703.1 TonB-dependent outer membrane receptor, SusC/RagA subfamily, signature region [Zhouia amylolytica]